MRVHALIYNIGDFDNEIEVSKMNGATGMTKITIKPQVDRCDVIGSKLLFMLVKFLLFNLGFATASPMS